MARLRVVLLVLATMLLPSLASRPALSHEHGSGIARLLDVEGVIDPMSVRYLEREIGRAQRDQAELVVIRLDTPGGLDSSMRGIVQTLLASPLPVAVYVAPSGARAASAGMFVTLAAGVAAMAPGTEIGAAHPVRLGGGSSDDALEAKVVHDTAAFARTIADTRHRNAAWPERAVRESVSMTSDEALRARVIDLVAADVPDLLRQLDGRAVPTSSGEQIVHSGDLRIEARPMLLTERVIRVLSNPNVAYLLFLLGLLGIVAELYHPGAILPGTVGAIGLVLALVAFGNLPISWAGILLILLAIGLFVGELHTGAGGLAAAAVVALVFGSLMLYSPHEPAEPGPELRVSPVLIAVMTGAVAAFFLLVVRATLRARRLAVQTGIPVLLGRVGVATSNLSPSGTVRIDSEVWTAETDAGPIHTGERVMVVGAGGVTLHVVPA